MLHELALATLPNQVAFRSRGEHRPSLTSTAKCDLRSHSTNRLFTWRVLHWSKLIIIKYISCSTAGEDFLYLGVQSKRDRHSDALFNRIVHRYISVSNKPSARSCGLNDELRLSWSNLWNRMRSPMEWRGSKMTGMWRWCWCLDVRANPVVRRSTNVRPDIIMNSHSLTRMSLLLIEYLSLAESHAPMVKGHLHVPFPCPAKSSSPHVKGHTVHEVSAAIGEPFQSSLTGNSSPHSALKDPYIRRSKPSYRSTHWLSCHTKFLRNSDFISLSLIRPCRTLSYTNPTFWSF